MTNINFIDEFNSMQKYCHETTVNHGFHEDQDELIANSTTHQADIIELAVKCQKLALMHSEISEALEAVRKGDSPSEKIPEYSHVEEELADTVIRIFDFSEHYGLNVGAAIVAKAAYNEGRPYKHNKKF